MLFYGNTCTDPFWTLIWIYFTKEEALHHPAKLVGFFPTNPSISSASSRKYIQGNRVPEDFKTVLRSLRHHISILVKAKEHFNVWAQCVRNIWSSLCAVLPSRDYAIEWVKIGGCSDLYDVCTALDWVGTTVGVKVMAPHLSLFWGQSFWDGSWVVKPIDHDLYVHQECIGPFLHLCTGTWATWHLLHGINDELI